MKTMIEGTLEQTISASVPAWKNRKFVAPTLALIVTIISVLSRTYLDVEFSSQELIAFMVGLWGVTSWIVKMDGDYDKAQLQSDVTDKFETFTQIADLLSNSGILSKIIAATSPELVEVPKKEAAL